LDCNRRSLGLTRARCTKQRFNRGNLMKRLFVENFRSNTTHSALLELFREKGRVDSITLYASRNGDPLGYAFVVMENDGEAASALRELNNSNWNGIRLTVTAADYPR